MVIDSSALVAILTAEPEQQGFVEAIMADPNRLCAAPTLVETGLVIASRRGDAGLAAMQAFIERAAIRTASFQALHADLAIAAFRRYGKGRHPAALNFGDCMSYALAKATGEKLLFKGGDFPLTDIEAAA